LLSKLYFSILLIILLSVGLISFYLFFPQYHTSLDDRLRDLLFLSRGEINTTKEIVIVDIDEKSLKELGQWPWEREYLAQMLVNLTNSDVKIIGLDIMFPEYDKTSPHRLAEKLDLNISEFDNYDLILGYVLSQTPTILGYTFDFNNDLHTEEPVDPPQIPAIFIEQNLPENEDFILKSKNVILNIPEIQENGYSSGFFNNTPDSSGLVRSVPLIVKYDDQVFPSLALEMFRVASEENMVNIYYDEIGIGGIAFGETFIPTDRFGRLFVNFRGDARSFDYVSASDVVLGNFDPEVFKDKYVLVGSSAAGLLDIRSIPFDSYFPGVEVHANIIDNIIKGDFLYKPEWVEGADILIILLTVIFVTFALVYLPPFMMLTTIVTGYFAFWFALYHILFEYGYVFNVLFPFLTLSVTAFLILFENFFFESKQKKLIKGKFAAKVSPAVMEDLIKNPDSDVMLGHEREITVMFSDVRNFTNISESMPNAKTLIEFLNEYMDPMTEIITKSGGTVDKFIGDAIMAYWNAPLDIDNHADKAVVATIQQLHACVPLNEKIKKDPRFTATCEMAAGMGKEPIEIGIGLNTGVAVVGEMGSKGRSDYTVIGDPINLGARLESLCKYYNSKCNISNFTKDMLDEKKYIFRFLDLVTVKGKSEPIEIWQIHDFENGLNGNYLFDVSREEIQKELDLYNHAIELYKNANFTEAIKIFKDINSWKNKTNLNIYEMYIERCEHYIEHPPENFNGVFKHTTKG
jgi:adenylate cyclase